MLLYGVYTFKRIVYIWDGLEFMLYAVVISNRADTARRCENRDIKRENINW